jgi:fatty-acid desaturase
MKVESASADTTTVPSRHRGLLEEPTFGWGEIVPHKPTLREIFVEWFDAINFFKKPTRLLTAMFTAFHVVTFGVFVFFSIRHFSILIVVLITGIIVMITIIYNTVWYHRYCTHRAYKFSHLAWARLFLWTNPICFREESYVIPHHVHHSKEGKPGDPYGPHLGCLGSYLASESSAKTNLTINRSGYGRLAKGLKHIGIPLNSYEQFQRTGSVEKAWHWIARSIFANGLWCSLAFLIGGGVGVLMWLSGVFLYTFVVRDFNYRGHGGSFFRASKGRAANHVFYGIICGEWHLNHHDHPRIAHSGIKWWQVDIPYYFIKAMSLCGIVEQMNMLKEKAPPQPVNAAREIKAHAPLKSAPAPVDRAIPRAMPK